MACGDTRKLNNIFPPFPACDIRCLGHTRNDNNVSSAVIIGDHRGEIKIAKRVLIIWFPNQPTVLVMKFMFAKVASLEIDLAKLGQVHMFTIDMHMLFTIHNFLNKFNCIHLLWFFIHGSG